MSKISVDKIKRLKGYLHKDKHDKEENILSRQDSNITLLDDSENPLKDKEQDEISIAGSEQTLVDEEQKSIQSDDEITLVGDEEDLENKDLKKENSSESIYFDTIQEESVENKGLKKEMSSESIYFDAIQEENAKTYIENQIREELQDSQLSKLLDKTEAKKEEIDDVVLNDNLWSLVNRVGRGYINGFLYEKEYKKMDTAERFIMDKIVDEKLSKYYEKEINQIARDVNKSSTKKLYDTLNVLRLYFVGKTSFIKDLEKDVNKIKIENEHSKKIMKNELGKKGVKKDSIMKEVDFLLNQIKNTTLYGGYYYAVFKGIDNITKDISHDGVDSENVVLFDLSDPVKQKGDKLYFYDYELNKKHMCQGDELQLKYREILRERDYGKDIVSNIKHLNQRGTYYIVEKGQERDGLSIDAVYEDSDVKIYDISNPLNLKDGEFYYGDYKLDKDRLLKVEQDRTFESLMDLLTDSEILIKNTVYYLEGTKGAVDLLEYIHIRDGNMDYQEEKEIIEKLNRGINEVEDYVIRMKKACKYLKTKINEYSELKGKDSVKIDELGIEDTKAKVKELQKTLQEKSKELFGYQEKVSKENLRIEVDKFIDTTNKGSKGIRKLTEKVAFYILGADDSKGDKKGVLQFLADKSISGNFKVKELILQEAIRRDEEKRNKEKKNKFDTINKSKSSKTKNKVFKKSKDTSIKV